MAWRGGGWPAIRLVAPEGMHVIPETDGSTSIFKMRTMPQKHPPVLTNRCMDRHAEVDVHLAFFISLTSKPVAASTPAALASSLLASLALEEAARTPHTPRPTIRPKAMKGRIATVGC
jgi:hypothetical protein